jgi:hypothetical protein
VEKMSLNSKLLLALAKRIFGGKWADLGRASGLWEPELARHATAPWKSLGFGGRTPRKDPKSEERLVALPGHDP